MHRRDFFRRTLGAFVAAAAAPFLPKPRRMVDPQLGISIRFIRQFDVVSHTGLPAGRIWIYEHPRPLGVVRSD